MKNLHITAYGATDFVGRSSFVIGDKDHNVMLDCGIQLIPNKLSEAPKGLEKIAQNLDAVILSHAHIDHTGYAPKMVDFGFEGNYFMTQPTKDIVYRLWMDHLKIEGERHWREDDLDQTYTKIKTFEYKKKIKIADGITAEFMNAGHVLGAAQVLIDWEGTLILYTGDINDRVTPMFDGYDLPEEDIDILIIESTNGDRYVPERYKIDVGFRMIAKQTVEEGHKMLLPSFAVGRSQETLITLALDPDLDNVPVYIDGMINTMNMITEAYLSEKWVSKRLLDNLKERGLVSPFKKENFIPVSSISDKRYRARKYIATNKEGSLIVTTSGMVMGGPIHSYLEYCGWKKENIIGFTGYQVQGTTGREIVDGEKKIKIFGERYHPKTIDLKAQIMKFPYSGHSSVDGLKRYMHESKAENIFLVHGEKRNQDYIMNFVKDIASPKTLNEHEKTPLMDN